VIADPNSYRRHARKISTVESDFPLHGMWRRDRWLILDSIHRLVRADPAGHTGVQVVTLSIQDVATIAGVSVSDNDPGGRARDMGCRP
jgi:hypothetical protein